MNRSEDDLVELEKWIARARAGDPRAMDRVAEFADRVFRPMATRVMREFPTVAAYCEGGDLFQEAILKLFRRYKRRPKNLPADPKLLGLQIRGAIREVAIDRFRSLDGPLGLAKNEAGPITLEPEKDETGVVTRVDRADRRERIRAHVKSLPKDHREVVELRIFEGMTYPLIAEALGVNIKTVENRLHAALRSLETKLARTGGPGR